MKQLIKSSKQKGITLLEILITVVILSIGILGVAALQVKGSQFNHSAYLRSQAAFLAYDILDRMRANKTSATTSSGYLTNFGSGTPTYSTNCTSANCSASQMAQYDLYEWKTSIFNILPGGDGEITFVAGATPGTRIYTINLQWQDSRSGIGILQPFTIKAEL